jgi:hypothetical protein
VIPVAERVRSAPTTSVISGDAAADLRTPVLIGVTGHRDLRPGDVATLAARFGDFVRGLRARAPHTPLVLLSGLAEGADSLAAEVALAENIPVVACLPFPVERYRQDFEGAALANFERLLAASIEVRVIVGDAGYLGQGRYVAHYAHLLVAFWDGTENGKPGGTGDIVRFRRDGSVRASAEAMLMGAADIGSVYQFVTPRVSNPNVPGVGNEHWIVADVPGISEKHLIAAEDESLSHIDRFNVDAASGDGGSAQTSLVERLSRTTDASAHRFQVLTEGAARFIFVLAFFSAMAVTIAEHPIGPTKAALLKIGGIALAFLAYLYVRRNDVQNRYQDYRALEEGLRVQEAWIAFGLTDAVYRNYLRMQLGELRWIRDVLRAVYFRVEPPLGRAGNTWLQEQRDYYSTASERNKRKLRIANGVAVAATAIGILAGIALGISVPAHLFFSPLEVYVLSTVVTGAAVLATLVLSYAEFRGYGESSRRYARMYRLFALAATAAAAADETTRGGLVLEVGREALVEHAQWLLLRRERPIDVVRAA